MAADDRGIGIVVGIIASSEHHHGSGGIDLVVGRVDVRVTHRIQAFVRGSGIRGIEAASGVEFGGLRIGHRHEIPGPAVILGGNVEVGAVVRAVRSTQVRAHLAGSAVTANIPTDRAFPVLAEVGVLIAVRPLAEPAGYRELPARIEVAVMGAATEAVHDTEVSAVGVEVIPGRAPIGVAGEFIGGAQAAEQRCVVIALAEAAVIGEVENGLPGDICIVEGPVRDQGVAEGGETGDGYRDGSVTAGQGVLVARGVTEGLHAGLPGEQGLEHGRPGGIEGQGLIAGVDAHRALRRLGDCSDFQVAAATVRAVDLVVGEYRNGGRAFLIGGGRVVGDRFRQGELQGLGLVDLHQGVFIRHVAGEFARSACVADLGPVVSVRAGTVHRGAHRTVKQGPDRGIVRLEPGEVTQAVPGGDLLM